MPRRLIAFMALAVALAVLFIRLGFWQLSRLEERQAFNARRALPLSQPEVPFDSVEGSTSYRRVVVAGEPDYANEIIVAGRSRNGSPGVHLLTPFRRSGRDTAVLVNRGWIYSPDAATVDATRFRESVGTVHGYTDTLMNGAPAVDAARPRVLRRLTQEGVRRLLPYPAVPTYVIAQDSAGPDAPARLPLPELGDGPHLGYAIQWFAFALTALGGAGIVLWRGRARGRGDAGSTAARGDGKAELD